MPEDTFRSMILSLEMLGISRNQIAQNAGISPATVWRLAELQGWRPAPATAQKVVEVQRQMSYSRTTVLNVK